jgi:hypothetical protein
MPSQNHTLCWHCLSYNIIILLFLLQFIIIIIIIIIQDFFKT